MIKILLAESGTISYECCCYFQQLQTPVSQILKMLSQIIGVPGGVAAFCTIRVGGRQKNKLYEIFILKIMISGHGIFSSGIFFF